MKKYLPYVIPAICGYGQFTIALSILYSEPSQEVDTWFAQSFIQLVSLRNEKHILFENEFGDNQFMNSPFLDKYIIPMSMVQQSNLDIVEVSRYYLERNTYIGYLCDRFYFPFCTEEYQTQHFTHFVLLTGFDDESQTVRIADYFNHKYMLCECPYHILRNAAMSKYCVSPQPYEDSILCVRRRDFLTFPISFNRERLTYLAREYLKGYEGKEISTGICIYNELSQYVQEGTLRYNVIQTIYDHKLAMCRRLKILRAYGYASISDQDELYFEKVLEQAQILRNILIRQHILKGKNSKLTTQHTLDCIARYREMDIDAMNYFINIIQNR